MILKKTALVAVWFCMAASSTVVAADTIVNGDFRILGSGNLVFSDGTSQKSAQVKGDTGQQGAIGPAGPVNTLTMGTVATGNPGSAASAAITGTAPNQTLNLILPQGQQGPVGPGVTTKWSWTKESYVNFLAAGTQTNSLILYHDTSGKTSGFSQTTQNGPSGAPVMSMTYYTNYDTQGSPLTGINVKNDSLTPYKFIESNSYDTAGKRTQRVRTVYDNSNALVQIQTRNHDVNHNGAITSEITVAGSVTTTVIYSYGAYDPNGYPSLATTSTTKVDSSSGTTTNWNGYALFEYEQFIPTSSGSSSGAPLINATILSFPGPSTIGWTSQIQIYTDNTQQTPVTTAAVTVTANGTPTTLSYDAAKQQYTGSSLIPLGSSITLSVTIGGTTYTTAATQYSTYPTITTPSAGASWNAATANDITWSGGTPTANAEYVVGILGGNGQFVFPVPPPSGGGPAEVATTTTSYTVSANSVAHGSYQAIVGIGTPGLGSGNSGSGILIPGTASGSGLWVGAVTANAVTFQ